MNLPTCPACKRHNVTELIRAEGFKTDGYALETEGGQ